MKINVAQILKNYQGKPIISPGSKDKLDLRTVISSSINATPAPPAKPMSAEDKNKAYQISLKIWAKKNVDLTVDQRTFIKGKVFEVYNPLVAGRVSDIFEGEKMEDVKKQNKKNPKAKA